MAKKQKIDTTFMGPVEIYKLVISGKLKIFPKCYWAQPESLR